MILKKLFPVLIILLLSSWILWNIGSFPFPPGSEYSDFSISHFPNAVYLKNSLTIYRQIPLWSSTILSGYPFVANPLSGIWYFPNWLVLWLDAQTGINLLVFLHLIFGSLGMYFLLLRIIKAEFPSLIGAIMFICMPKLIAHYGAGHVSLIYSVCWTPWLLFAEEKTIEFNHFRPKIYPGIVLGMILLADVRWFPMALVLWVGYRFGISHGAIFKNIRSVFKEIIVKFFQILLSLCLSSPLLIPMFEYVRLSTRVNLISSDQLIYSLPPEKLLGFLVPDFWGSAEGMTYFGSLCMVMFVYVLSIKKIRRLYWFWITILLISIAMSLGEYIPGINLIYRFPGLDLLRVPSRWLLVSGIALAVLIPSGIKELTEGHLHAFTFNPGLLWAGLLAFMLMITAGIWFVNLKAPLEFIWGTTFLMIFTFLIWMRKNNVITNKIFFISFIPFLCLDLLGIDKSLIDFRNSTEVLRFPTQIRNILQPSDVIYRIYSPSYSVPQQIAAINNYSLADGVDPLQLFAYVHFMEKATGVPQNAYSVTVPAFANGKPFIDNQSFQSDARLLGLLNIKYVLAQYTLYSDGLVFQGQWDGTKVYKNVYFLPRAWLQKSDAPIGQNIISQPEIKITPNSIHLIVTGPGLLVVSELNYPGWVVHIDEAKASFLDFELFRVVKIPAAEHIVSITFRPLSVFIGFGVCVITWLVIVLLNVKSMKCV
jgi:hypothetical protein